MEGKTFPTAGSEGPVTVQPILSPIPGWYGKMPCLGDFASRRLPPEFIETWDAWLQRSIAASRIELGDRWLDLFLTSPIWRFALASGVCGKHPWAGVLLPSVDKVGRYFPLTFAVPVEPSDGNLAHIFAAEAWYASLERIALAALNVEFDPEQLEAALARNPFPPSRFTSAQGVTREMAAWIAGGSQPRNFLFSGSDSIGEVMEDAAQALYAASAAGRTFWWAVADTATAATEAHGSVGLPPPEYYAVLLGGSRQDESDALSTDPLKAFGFENAADDPELLR